VSTTEETFSKFLGLKPIDFVKAGLLDQPLLKDAPYYIDIFKFKEIDIPEFKESYSNFLFHFSKFFKLIKASKRNGVSSFSNTQVLGLNASEIKQICRDSDPAFQAAYNQLNFKEIDGFNLGYSKSLHGASIGPSFKVQLIKAAQELLDLNIDDPEIFCLLPFLQEGIGCDRISDMFVSINYLHFLKYTERKLKEMSVSGTLVLNIDGSTLTLAKPNEFKDPLILIPKELVKQIPLSFNWSDIFDCYDENSALRSRLSSIILSHYNKKSEATKANVSALLKGNPGLLREIILEFKETTPLSQLERELLQEIEKELTNLSVPSQPMLKDKVLFIINRFKMYVERKGIWKLFYHRTKDENGEKIKQPLSEDHVQRAFYLIADIIADKFSIELIPEAETGVGPVDFKFSHLRKNILVEAKLSTHKDIRHGYMTQLEEYIKSENPEHSYFLLIKLTNSDSNEMEVDERRLSRLLSIEKNQGSHKEIIVVDATVKESASKKKETPK
jgi:hypothetical protein